MHDSLERAGRILRQEEFESLEEQVKIQADALKAMYAAMRELAQELDRQLAELRGNPSPRGVRY